MYKKLDDPKFRKCKFNLIQATQKKGYWYGYSIFKVVVRVGLHSVKQQVLTIRQD
jgi:hypothetical protein